MNLQVGVPDGRRLLTRGGRVADGRYDYYYYYYYYCYCYCYCYYYYC